MRKYHTTESEFRGGFPMDEGNAAGPYGDRPSGARLPFGMQAHKEAVRVQN
ncbi:hypothetical protein C4J98_1726 [Pseudomonas orientalis]|nr:hypothetical protein C4J98_1726 [Pseudomonas orientalis]